MSTLVPFVNLQVNLIPAQQAQNLSKAVMLFGQRNTEGLLKIADSGYPQLDYYKPIKMPAFSSGIEAINYLKNFGLNGNLGISFVETYPQPDAVVASNGITILTWNTVPANFTQLISMNLAGVLAQGIFSGQVKSATTVVVGSSIKAIMYVYGTPDFSTSGGTMTLTGTNNIQYPDPNEADPICCMAWDFYQTALSDFTSGEGAPFAYLYITSDRDPSITPVNTPIDLVAPNAVSQTGNVAVLTYNSATTVAGLGYLPFSILGNTTVTQNTSTATGTYGGMVIVGSSVQITVTDVTGTFVTGDTIEVVLDNSYSVMPFLDNIELSSTVLQFPIKQLTDITVTHADYFNLVDELNLGNQVLNQHYGTFGFAGNTTSLPSQAVNLPDINNSRYVLVTYPYLPVFGDIPYDNDAGTLAGGRVAASVAYLIANNDIPYPNRQKSIITHIPVSTSINAQNYSPAPGNTGEFAIEQGWLPLLPNQNGGGISLLQSNTAMTTIPNTNIPDNEFRFTHDWQCIQYLKKQATQTFIKLATLPNNQGQAILSADWIFKFDKAIIQMLQTADNLGIIENVDTYINLVVVRESLIDPGVVDVYIPAQIIPGILGMTGLINIFSSTINLAAA